MGTAVPIQPFDPDVIDLDDFLQTNNQQSAASNSAAARLRTTADRVVIAGFEIDDSGSMAGLTSALREGVNLGVESFRGAKGSDFHLLISGFKKSYFDGPISDFKDDSLESYNATHGHTPVVSCSMSLLRELRAKAQEFRQLGIPTTIAMLIITDGMPFNDGASPRDFAKIMENGEYIVGMGIANTDHNYSIDEAILNFRKLFKDMGINIIITPKSDPSEVRHAINQYSQSVASIGL